MASMAELRKLLCADAPLSEQNIDLILDYAEEHHYKTNEVIIRQGGIDSGVYIIKEGIIRAFYLKEGKETTLYFGKEGDIVMSMFCFQENLPSFLEIEACCETSVLRISKSEFQKLCKSSLEIANWALELTFVQLFFVEKKRQIVAGNALERYQSLVENRSELLQKIPLKVIASYLGITQQSLSRLRNPKYKK